MKASELMVGDYLQYNGMPYRVIQVNGIVGDSFMLENGEEDCGEPILLTDGIIAKNGFCYDFDSDECIDDGIYVTHEGYVYKEENAIVYYCNGLVRICTCDNRGIIKVFKYVHELQHALRLCGIRKEIVL